MQPCPFLFLPKLIELFSLVKLGEFHGGRKSIGWAFRFNWRPRNNNSSSGLHFMRGCHQQCVAQVLSFQMTKSKR